MTLQVWGALLDEVLDQMLAQRKIFLLHQRNQAALEKLHRKDHDDEHEDIQQRFRQALADPSLSLRDRVRMACSLGAVLGGLLMAGDAFHNVSSGELCAHALVRHRPAPDRQVVVCCWPAPIPPPSVAWCLATPTSATSSCWWRPGSRRSRRSGSRP